MSPSASAPAPAPPQQQSDIAAHKSDIRARIWQQLRAVAYPDSRFDFDFSSFIADFAGSDGATARLAALPAYRDASVVFIAPDNCLEQLRRDALRDGKTVLVTTYGIRRGFWLLDPRTMPAAGLSVEYAATLDGMERAGRAVALSSVARLRVDLLVTGTGAINTAGVRFGKGHGYFDLEWALLYSVGAVDAATPAVALVHDCQVVPDDVTLVPDEFDTVVDFVVTPSTVVEVEDPQKPVVGILWERLREGMVEGIPPLRELRALMEEQGCETSVELRGRR
ncbi:5-formyltetrahydrofolate cyclo-ligase [Phyllosticta citribraziliensis]|uniref:5-formyltetrahydrofolate cyclo-ligase n=1 Tax=Phyllosticta citribraziliensis TaxID=989973 RepID=A0ABR1M668_9PEZI